MPCGAASHVNELVLDDRVGKHGRQDPLPLHGHLEQVLGHVLPFVFSTVFELALALGADPQAEQVPQGRIVMLEWSRKRRAREMRGRVPTARNPADSLPRAPRVRWPPQLQHSSRGFRPGPGQRAVGTPRWWSGTCLKSPHGWLATLLQQGPAFVLWQRPRRVVIATECCHFWVRAPSGFACVHFRDL